MGISGSSQVGLKTGVCTSTTRPSAPYVGQTIYESDTGSFLVYYGSTTGWKPPWGQPWGSISYASTPSNVSVKNGNILTSTIGVLNNRRYRIHGHCNSFISTVASDVASVSIVVGGTVIQATNDGQVSGIIGGFGVDVVGYYTATATNASLGCNLYNITSGTGTHTFSAAATTPISIAVEDIGPAVSTAPTS